MSRTIADEVGCILDAVQCHLAQKDRDSIVELIQVGEWGIALENICTQLYEYEAPVSWVTYQQIKKCGERMKLSAHSWEFLRELVVHPGEQQ